MQYQIDQNTINNLPSITLQGLLKDENRFINDWLKYLLQYAKDYNSSNEVGIILDKTNWDNYDVTLGTNHSVKFNTEKMKKWLDCGNDNLIVIHNHPSDGIFSDKDIFNFCKSQSINTLIVVGNRGSIYLIQKQYGFDKKKLILYYSDVEKQLKDKYSRRKILEILLQNYQKELHIYFKKETILC